MCGHDYPKPWLVVTYFTCYMLNSVYILFFFYYFPIVCYCCVPQIVSPSVQLEVRQGSSLFLHSDAVRSRNVTSFCLFGIPRVPLTSDRMRRSFFSSLLTKEKEGDRARLHPACARSPASGTFYFLYEYRKTEIQISLALIMTKIVTKMLEYIIYRYVSLNPKKYMRIPVLKPG